MAAEGAELPTFSTRKRQRSSGRIEQGDPVRVAASCGGELDGGGTFELRGERGRIIGANPVYRSERTGERMAAVQLEGGAIVTVPVRALRRERG